MNKFNLTFWGEILPGRNPEKVKASFAQLFDIRDPEQLERFFSGETVILRRNLDRKVAAEYYAKLHKLGVEAELRKLASPEGAADSATGASADDTPEQALKTRQAQWDQARAQAEQEYMARAAKRQLQRQQQADKREEQSRRKALEQQQRSQAKIEAAARKQRKREAAAHKRAEDSARRQRQAAARRAAQAAEQAARSAREQALEDEREAARQRLEEQAMDRGAAALTMTTRFTTKMATVRSALQLPRRQKLGSTPARKRQAGAPNAYRAHPFRNTTAVRGRAALARATLARSLAVTAGVAGLTLLLAGYYVSLEPAANVSGPDHIAATPGGRLIIQAGDQLLLHDRSGAGQRNLHLAQLGLAGDSDILGFDPGARLLLWGAVADTAGPYGLWYCDRPLQACTPLSGLEPAAPPDALAIHPMSGELFTANTAAATLYRHDTEGRLRNSAAMPLASQPIIHLEMGLLFSNSPEGPAIGVYRYDTSAFGKQLDEILLLPPPALAESQTRVRDFIHSGENWWVSLYNPDSGSAGLYLFDSDWNYLKQFEVPASLAAGRLSRWGEKVLLHHPGEARVLRFSAAGAAEADFLSAPLEALVTEQNRHQRLMSTAWGAVFSLCLVALLSCAAHGSHQYFRSRVYLHREPRGPEPLEQYIDQVHWIDPVLDRHRELLRTGLAYGLACAAALLLITGLGAAPYTVCAAVLALTGPAIGLLLYGRGARGHVGRAGDTLVLVDHRNMYHLASGARIQHRGPVLMVDDVVVFTGTALLPNLDPEQRGAVIAPLLRHGARVDRKTVLVKMLEARHPLATAGLVCAGALLSAAVVLVAASF